MLLLLSHFFLFMILFMQSLREIILGINGLCVTGQHILGFAYPFSQIVSTYFFFFGNLILSIDMNKKAYRYKPQLTLLLFIEFYWLGGKVPVIIKTHLFPRVCAGTHANWGGTDSFETSCRIISWHIYFVCVCYCKLRRDRHKTKATDRLALIVV